jgi:osmotically-inducible protein OsmY
MRDITNSTGLTEDTTNRGHIGRTTNPTLTLLAGVGIGAVMSYFLDPDRGAKRRALVRDQVSSLLRSAGRDVNARARDVKHRVEGAVAESRARSSDEIPDNDQLAARVRAALGHHVEQVRPIEVTAENGRVILRGQAQAHEIEDVITTAQSVRGVAQVENHLEPLQQSPQTQSTDLSDAL